jgi:hypothetical protein
MPTEGGNLSMLVIGGPVEAGRNTRRQWKSAGFDLVVCSRIKQPAERALDNSAKRQESPGLVDLQETGPLKIPFDIQAL